MRILVADDERITRASIVRQIERLGHVIAVAEDGRSAWEQLQREDFDIVLTDWEMPHLSGVELVERIKSRPQSAFTYVIMLTSRSQKEDLVKAIEVGADDYIAKPFSKEEVRVRLLAGQRMVDVERRLAQQNAQLRAASERLRSDLDAAARVQHAMLPKSLLQNEHFRTAWRFVPTDELAGDAIGLHLLDDRYLMAYVLDVSGHGVPAALLSVSAMHQIAQLLQAAGDGMGESDSVAPASIIGSINRHFDFGETDGRFLTMVLSVVDVASREVRVCCAGHPLPILVRDGQASELKNEGGLPLAIDVDAKYRDASIPLRSGDRIYLFSDGLVEQYDPTEADQFGVDRIIDAVLHQRHLPPDDAVDALIATVADWAGNEPFKDDVSVVVTDWIG